MDELKHGPLQQHSCKAMEHCKTISISKRFLNGQERWMWERSQKDGKITADEITYCPYCAIDLNRNAAPEDKPDIDQLDGLLDEIVLARLTPDEVITQANKLKDALTDLRRAAPENKPLTLEQLKIENTQLRAVIMDVDPDFFKRKCRVCGCDWNHPCNNHDYWVEDDLCSVCAGSQCIEKPQRPHNNDG